MKRLVAFGTVCVIAAAIPVAYFARGGGNDAAARSQGAKAPERRGAAAVAAVLRVRHVLVRDTSPGAAYGELALAPLAGPRAPRAVLDLECDRIDFRSGRGICLQTRGGFLTDYVAAILDSHFRVVHRLSLPGPTSRARMSPNGLLAAYTVFVAGDSYAASGFSTRTGIIDTTTGKHLVQLERFKVFDHGREIHRADFNFWGVTFASDSDHFYATLGTRGETYLVKGSVSSRRFQILRSGVECPSLSPDGRRIAFKKRLSSHGRVEWRPAVLDLTTLRAHVLPETRNVDDQIAWVDAQHVAYGLQVPHTGTTDVWTLRADGSGRPRLLVAGGWSPSVQPADSGATARGPFPPAA
jgi:hypothetical protein